MVFGDDSLARKKNYEWFNCFRGGFKSVQQNKITARPSTSSDETIGNVKKMFLETRDCQRGC